METTISVPAEMLRRVDEAARQRGIARSDFFVQAAERWLKARDDDTRAAINRVLAGLPADHAFANAAASALVHDDPAAEAARRARSSPRRRSPSEFRRGGEQVRSRWVRRAGFG